MKWLNIISSNFTTFWIVQEFDAAIKELQVIILKLSKGLGTMKFTWLRTAFRKVGYLKLYPRRQWLQCYVQVIPSATMQNKLMT